jgi:hypothetical protein
MDAAVDIGPAAQRLKLIPVLAGPVGEDLHV